jgi:CubicO group peptidase (beta-lactamase class C family)
MNDDELKRLWQQQPLRKPDMSPEQLISAMHKQTSQLRRILDARDLRELVACALVAIIFGIFYFTVYRTPVSRLGALIVIGGAIFVAWKLVHTRRKTSPAPPGATVVKSLQAELKAVRAQSRLLGSVRWWYLLPGGIGVLLCAWGGGGGLAGNIGYTIFVITLNAFIYWLNQRARDKQLLPVEAQLESLIRSAETGEPPEESRVADLRPIVLSMQTAEHIKPVEFKVAFWQLAIYGVPGIVGIWFILIFSSTVNNLVWKVHERAVENRAPGVRTEETNRYFIVTRKLVDRLNAGDYAAVQTLYNADMSKFFPPQETTNFYTGIAARYGKIETFDGPTGNGYRGWTAFRLVCQHSEMTMSLALDADDNISGIYFKPASMQLADFKNYATIKNLKSFLRHLFSWPHLLWGVLSFVGGLIYTWLIQKTVKRAVGISPLGIHLQNGNSLILWDEIKEVRPFKFLNIRNLTLITESGEKTRMHWTPLERHADVKAAVEKFAPANHPIRQYLPLLRTKSSMKNIMTKTILIGIVVISFGAIVFVCARETKTSTVEYSDSVSQMLETIRKKHDLPALAVVVVKDGQICEREVTGVRKSGDDTLVTTNDVFHIGSCTKSMTATLTAMLIEAGKLKWDTTIAEIFPELRGKMDQQYEAVTIEQLLHHRGGVPGAPPAAAWAKAWKETGTPTQQRREFIEAVLAAPPEAAPGTKLIYSNQGYAIVGAMLEKITGTNYETLLTEKLFWPLHMDSAGFGSPGTEGKTDQPWGHQKTDSRASPVQLDNPPAITPAGRVHCSLDDLARFVMLHLQGTATNGLLKPETLARLHAPGADGAYACGWVLMKRGWAGGTALMHNGSNTFWYIVMWLAPEKNFAVIAATNIYGDDAEKGCDDAASAMIQKWLPEK